MGEHPAVTFNSERGGCPIRGVLKASAILNTSPFPASSSSLRARVRRPLVAVAVPIVAPRCRRPPASMPHVALSPGPRPPPNVAPPSPLSRRPRRPRPCPRRRQPPLRPRRPVDVAPAADPVEHLLARTCTVLWYWGWTDSYHKFTDMVAVQLKWNQMVNIQW